VGYQNNLYLKFVQMDPQQLPNTSEFYSISNKCDMQKTVAGTTPILVA